MNSFFNPEEDISKTDNNLPHWHQDHTFCFVTWRMGDSLPQARLNEWKEKRRCWIIQNPKPWDEEKQRSYREHFHDTIDQWLDAGSGSCALAQEGCRSILEEALHYRDPKVFRLEAYVIMPNHVHLLVRLNEAHTLPLMMQSLKRHTARRINLLLNRSGSFWQEDYYDTLIRSPKHLKYVKDYIQRNPAKLKPYQFTLWERPL